MKSRGDLYTWVRVVMAVLGAGLCAAGGLWVSWWSLVLIAAGLALLLVLAHTDQLHEGGEGVRHIIDPDDYAVHMLRPFEQHVIVVVAQPKWFGYTQTFRMYDLPLGMFENDPCPYVGTSTVVMTVRLSHADGLRITLHRGKVKLNIVTAKNQKDRS